ncbi:MAG: hypothetical protein GY697_23990 [Desulfobacterales bacterium]|nr:hypothetical protein [Desulfobacterales bacterium]
MCKGHLIIAVLALMLMDKPAMGQEVLPDCIQTFAAGEINWRNGKITATGFSEPAKKKTGGQAVRNEALSAARKKAVNTLAGLISGLSLSGGQTVLDKMAAAPSIAEKVSEMVSSASVVQQTFMSDGAAEIVIEMSLYGGFAQLILPEDIRHIEAIQPVNVIKDKPGPTGKADAGRSPAGGLVIDARGLGITPAMMFAVIDESGKPVYGSAFISREYAVQWGMAAYVRRIPVGNVIPRVSPGSLVIKGLRAVGVGKSDIVISNADATKLKGAVENLILLRQGRVVIVLD